MNIDIVSVALALGESIAWATTGILLLALAWTWFRHRRQPAIPPEPSAPLLPEFAGRSLTERFSSTIPTLTREVNLELATAEHLETFERRDQQSLFWGWLPLGTSEMSITVPVTYRYHLRLFDRWELERSGSVLVVRAPAIRPSVPPAFDSSRMRCKAARGWLRLPPDDLLSELHRELTPRLTELASDPRRLSLVRETCRRSVEEFIWRWVGREREIEGIQAIQVTFAEEPILPGKEPRLLKQALKQNRLT